MKNDHRIVILGGGPTGLGAAWRLREHGFDNWTLFERSDRVGGLSSSFVDNKGFTWDVGGHVLFSHYPCFDQVVERALNGAYFRHQRESWVRIMDTWVPYPFQNNIRHLPGPARDECLEGLRRLKGNPEEAKNFREWMEAVFGDGIVRYFMAPYNFKVWAVPPEQMGKEWIAERVSVVDLARIEDNIAAGRDDVGWGPNNLFLFPRRGGTGAIYQGIAAPLKDGIRLGYELLELDLSRKRLRFANGETTGYDTLISTIPLDRLVASCVDAPTELRDAAERLVHNSVYVVGIGLRQKRSDSRCWMYFPEGNCPFYRVTNFHNYSPYNVPGGRVEEYSALMCETSFSPYKPVARGSVIEETVQGLINAGLLDSADRERIVSRYLIEVPYAYPVPTVDRDDALAVIQPFLEQHGIFSRGRFGAWKYEVGNMDHSFMQGVEVVDRFLLDAEERTIHGRVP